MVTGLAVIQPVLKGCVCSVLRIGMDRKAAALHRAVSVLILTVEAMVHVRTAVAIARLRKRRDFGQWTKVHARSVTLDGSGCSGSMAVGAARWIAMATAYAPRMVASVTNLPPCSSIQTMRAISPAMEPVAHAVPLGGETTPLACVLQQLAMVMVFAHKVAVSVTTLLFSQKLAFQEVGKEIGQARIALISVFQGSLAQIVCVRCLRTA